MIWPNPLISRTQPSGPLCLWQCFHNHWIDFQWSISWGLCSIFSNVGETVMAQEMHASKYETQPSIGSMTGHNNFHFFVMPWSFRTARQTAMASLGEHLQEDWRLLPWWEAIIYYYLVVYYIIYYIIYTCRRIEDCCLDKKQLFAGGWLAGALLQMASGCPLMVSGSEKVWVLILQQWD